MGFLMAQMVKNLPAMQVTWVQFLGQEDTVEKGMATHSSIIAWRMPWTEEPDSPWGYKESDTAERLTFTFRHIDRGQGSLVCCGPCDHKESNTI